MKILVAAAKPQFESVSRTRHSYSPRDAFSFGAGAQSLRYFESIISYELSIHTPKTQTKIHWFPYDQNEHPCA
jgi:hypothetical protein